MSVEDLKEFGKKIAENEEIKNRAKEIGLDPKGIIAYGKELGLKFDEEDMKTLSAEADVTEEELSEEELEKIAGGLATTTILAAGAGLVAAGAAGVVAGLVVAGIAGGAGAALGAISTSAEILNW